MSDPTRQIEWGLRYIRDGGRKPAPLPSPGAYGIPQALPAAAGTHGGMLTPGQAEAFCEEDEDPAQVIAAFDAGPRFLTAPPAGHDHECGFCSQGACARCSDKRCTCCAGNPEDLTQAR